MDRRQFFRHAFNKGAETVTKVVDQHVSQRASHWLRPPYALDELDFLLACTRCDACVTACPHQVIFSLPARLGIQVVGTPAMDLLNKACHLCNDWPCVTACEPGALRREIATVEEDDKDKDQEQPIPLPRLARAEIDTTHCLPYSGPECGACRDSCPVPGALLWSMEKPRIEPEHCIGCGLCREACIAAPNAIGIHSLHAQAASAASLT